MILFLSMLLLHVIIIILGIKLEVMEYVRLKQTHIVKAGQTDHLWPIQIDHIEVSFHKWYFS